ncbi:hypothetical protein PHLGIDRAFT_80839 [Phlebiopsis gigantea 11061_1 CR5-6]|uniref:Uncharacterized protein n=1 Tax=Phlebiopsis gigantea (strain 11061_1 CR5-6) TaxID=745531 RepID=A0A0C3P972_PHLG1|nr:hypothetical protein PHLGIDRAFT_80839 [Phlebiopsis gigantea 11061_1 CR5-6]
MPPYPDETLPSLTLSIKEFNDIAYKLLDHSYSNDVDPMNHTFVNFMLSGRYKDPDNGAEKRVRIDPCKGLASTSTIEDIEITRDYDSIIGISNNFPFSVPIAIYPIASFSLSLKKSNHLYKTIVTPVSGSDVGRRVSLHLIPNICLAKSDHRGKTLVFFPKLYRPGTQGQITQEEAACIYDKCLLPTIATILPEHIAHWPPGYQAALKQCRDVKGQLHFPTLDLPVGLLDQFNETLRTRFEAFSGFQNSFYLHECRGTKGRSVHDPQDPEQVNIALDHVFSSFDTSKIERAEDWYIDIGIEIALEGHVMHWLQDEHGAIIHHALPHLNNAAQAWDTSLFDRFFPSRAHLAKFNKPAQHFPHCGYYLRWQALINKTKGAGDEEIRASIRQEYNKLGWVPWNKADRMWIVESKETGQYSKLGVGRGQSGVRIAVNPMWGKKHSQMKLQTV